VSALLYSTLALHLIASGKVCISVSIILLTYVVDLLIHPLITLLLYITPLIFTVY